MMVQIVQKLESNFKNKFIEKSLPSVCIIEINLNLNIRK